MSEDTITLELEPAEASALSYFVAFAALHHTKGENKLTPHEDAMVTKVAQLDPDAFTMWRSAVQKAAWEGVGVHARDDDSLS